MSFQVITPSEIQTNSPIDSELLVKIKNNEEFLNQKDSDLMQMDSSLLSSIGSINADLLTKMASSFISTDNANYIRFGDLQFCWGVQTKNTNGTSTASFSFYYPKPFVGIPLIVHGINSSSSGYMYSVYAHSIDALTYNATLFENYSGRSSSTPITFSYLAIGKWR